MLPEGFPFHQLNYLPISTKPWTSPTYLIVSRDIDFHVIFYLDDWRPSWNYAMLWQKRCICNCHIFWQSSSFHRFISHYLFQYGYVLMSSDIQIQTCQGNIPATDLGNWQFFGWFVFVILWNNELYLISFKSVRLVCVRAAVVWQLLFFMNNFNKTGTAVSACNICFMRTSFVVLDSL